MKAFRPLAVASTVATFVLVAIGGLVRATKSGLGCGDDWPDCSGKLLPELEQRAQIIEFSHRATAGVVIVLLAALAFLAFRHYRSEPRILKLSVGALGLVLFQAVLGGVVVILHLDASSVVLHLATAMSLLAVLMFLDIGLFKTDGTGDASVSRKGAVAAGAVLVLLLVGSFVSGTDSGMAFPDWPLMNGALIPSFVVDAHAIHFLHRALAAVVGVIVAVVCFGVIRRKNELPAAARFAHAALGLFAIEVLIGAANVWTQLNAAFVTAHLAVGALIWTSLIGMTAAARPAVTIESRAEVHSRVVAEASS